MKTKLTYNDLHAMQASPWRKSFAFIPTKSAISTKWHWLCCVYRCKINNITTFEPDPETVDLVASRQFSAIQSSTPVSISAEEYTMLVLMNKNNELLRGKW